MSVQAVAKDRDPAPRTLPGRGNWWIQPVAIAVGFSLFVVYSTLSVGYSPHHIAGPYLSPYFSPVVPHSWWPFSSAWLVAWSPLAFRGTCYYYRKAYFRAYFWDPPACAIVEPSYRRHYTGETRLPWVLNNFHRFFLYLALIVLGFLWFDAVNAFHYHGTFYIGVGSILMVLNVVLLTAYTFSCHALRHLVGGAVDCFSCSAFNKARHPLWKGVSKINPFHGAFAWFSLVSVASVDIYVRIVSQVGNCFGAHTGC